jgi:translation initiation factor 2 beta subunit (eIF-2beta)/eIF-5
MRSPPGCSVCRRWDGSVVGDETGKRSRLEVCPGCGRVVPVRRLVIVVGLDLDLL